MVPHAIVNDGNIAIVPPDSTKTSLPQAKSHVLHRSFTRPFPTITSAEGLYINLSNGQRIVDASGGPAVSCLGHGNARVKAAIAKQQDTVSFCCGMFYSTVVAEELADELVRGTGGLMTKCFIISSGTSSLPLNPLFSP